MAKLASATPQDPTYGLCWGSEQNALSHRAHSQRHQPQIRLWFYMTLIMQSAIFIKHLHLFRLRGTPMVYFSPQLQAQHVITIPTFALGVLTGCFQSQHSPSSEVFSRSHKFPCWSATWSITGTRTFTCGPHLAGFKIQTQFMVGIEAPSQSFMTVKFFSGSLVKNYFLENHFNPVGLVS